MERILQETVVRTLIDKAVAYGRMRKSAQSGYLHFHHGTAEDHHHATIPVYDNFLYALALLRSRTIDNVNEAKEFIEKLLPFQIGDEGLEAGAFPIYIHDFPHAKDRYLSVPIGIVFCYILRDYAHVIGQELRDKLRASLRRLMAHLDNIKTQSPPPFRLLVGVAALHVAAGKALDSSQLTEQGKALLDSLEKTPNSAWYSPKTLGQLLSSLSLVYPSLEHSPWKDLWSFADMAWDRHTSTYVGPPFCQWQVREEPQVTLYDFFMSVHAGNLPKRACRDSHVLLEAAIIHLADDELAERYDAGEWTGTFAGSRWVVHKAPGLAYAGFDGKPVEVHQNQEKGFHNLVMLWGDRDRVHSLGCQRVRVGDVVCKPLENGVELIFSLEGGTVEEDRERNREIVVAVDRSHSSTFLVNGENSMVIQMGDELLIDEKIKMSFVLVEGGGKFLGHRMPGNRAAQAVSDAFEAYDWLMFMRSVNRTEPCKIALRIEKVC